MDNFKAVYRILSSLEKAMDLPQFDLRQIDAKALGVSETRWARYLEMMADVGYIKGVCIVRTCKKRGHSFECPPLNPAMTYPPGPFPAKYYQRAEA